MRTVHVQARLEHDHRPAERQREADLGERAVLASDRDDRIAGRDDREVARVADAGDDDVVDPLVRAFVASRREGSRSSSPPADFAPREAAAITSPSPPVTTVAPRSASKTTDLCGALFVLRAAPDDRDLDAHGRFSRCFVVSTPSKRSPISRTRSSTTSIVNDAGSSRSSTSSQRSGVDTGAPARGRTE